MAVSDVHSLGISDQMQKTQDVVVVVKRFANAHEDDTADTQSAVCLSRKQLSDQLSCFQIAHLPANR